MEWKDPNTGQIKLWVWGVVGLGAVIFFFLISKVMGSQTTASGTIPASGQSSDITDLISQLMDSINGLNDPTEPSPTEPPDTPDDPPDDPARTFKEYIVKAGDTWNSIAAKFGMTIGEFYDANPSLRNVGTPEQVRHGGRKIKVWDVPERTPTPQTFRLTRRIDTWTEVMQRFNLTREQFFALNPTLDTRREQNVNKERKAGREVIVGTSYT